MVTALVRLRAALQGAVLPLELPGVGEHRTRPRRDGRPARGLRHPAHRHPRGAAARGRRRLDRRRQVDAGQLPGRRGRDRVGRAPADHPVAGAGAQPGRRRLVRRRPAAARPRAGPPPDPRPPGAAARRRSTSCPQGLAILDAPDIDSVEESNRHLAAQLLAAADLWLFVTSAARYADQVPWDFLRQAAERSAAVAIVLDRTPAGRRRDRRHPPGPDAGGRGLKDSPLFTVNEVALNDDGLLAPRHVAEIRGWLAELGGRRRRPRRDGAGRPSRARSAR